MSQAQHLVATLKRLLKANGVTYAQVGEHLQLSEASVKRQFSQQSFSLHSLIAICDLLKIELAELVHAAEVDKAKISHLTEAQEAELVSDPIRVLVAVCVLNHWSYARIIETYALNAADCVRHLLQLDKLGMIYLLPENRVKLRIARDFSWLPGGPIHQFFREHAQHEFLNSDFSQPGELLRFQYAMLDPAASQQFQQRLHRLIQEFTDLHDDGRHPRQDGCSGTSLLIALRSWEPAIFAELRRSNTGK